MHRWISAALVLVAAGSATPRLSEPWIVGGLVLNQRLESCLETSLRSAQGIRYNGQRKPLATQTIQLFDFWMYGHYNDSGPRIVSAQALERVCPDGAYYLEVSVNLSGSIGDADPARFIALVDDLLGHISSTCHAGIVEVDGARQERSPKGRCAA